MKANELRIGNLVLDRFGNILEVESINFEGINLVGGDGYGVYPYYEFSKLQPIPLTEEWLLKFGFESPYTENYFIKSINGDFENGAYVFINPNNKGLGVAIDDVEKSTLNLKIDYVHQLQNLYFALTCEELTINQ